MNAAQSTTVNIYWRLDATKAQLAEVLDCPTFRERSPEVDTAWATYLGKQRHLASISVDDPNMPTTPTIERIKAREIEEWHYWNRPSEDVRQEHLDDFAVELTRNRDGLADIPFGQPGTSPFFNVGDLLNAPRILAVLDGRVHPDDLLDVNYLHARKRLAVSRTAEELADFAQRVYESHVDLVGQEYFDALITRDLEDARRIRLFNWCKAQQEMDRAAEQNYGYPLFESVILASSVVRWCYFWGSRGFGTTVPYAPPLDEDESESV